MEYKLGNIFVRDNASPHETGWRMDGHCHNFDHVTYIIAGKYRCVRKQRHVSDDGQEGWVTLFDREIEAPHWFLIKANEQHSFECLESPGMLHCLYSHRHPQTQEVIQEWNGWKDATV